MESIPVTDKFYEDVYFPFGSFLFIKKDGEPEKVGRLYTPPSARDAAAKWTTTATIIKKSLFAAFEDPYEAYVFERLKEGDRIGYSNTVPMFSPSPPHYLFEGEGKDQYQTIHVKDVVCVLCDSKEKQDEYARRFR